MVDGPDGTDRLDRNGPATESDIVEQRERQRRAFKRFFDPFFLGFYSAGVVALLISDWIFAAMLSFAGVWALMNLGADFILYPARRKTRLNSGHKHAHR